MRGSRVQAGVERARGRTGGHHPVGREPRPVRDQCDVPGRGGLDPRRRRVEGDGCRGARRAALAGHRPRRTERAPGQSTGAVADQRDDRAAGRREERDGGGQVSQPVQGSARRRRGGRAHSATGRLHQHRRGRLRARGRDARDRRVRRGDLPGAAVARPRCAADPRDRERRGCIERSTGRGSSPPGRYGHRARLWAGGQGRHHERGARGSCRWTISPRSWRSTRNARGS